MQQQAQATHVLHGIAEELQDVGAATEIAAALDSAATGIKIEDVTKKNHFILLLY